MEHRQGPQIDRMRRQAPGQDVAERQQIGAAVVIDDALGIARGARGVVQRDRIPLVAGQGIVEIGIAGRERSEEHTSELQSLMRISYAVSCMTKQNNTSPL